MSVGIDRLIEDLIVLGYSNATTIYDGNRNPFALLPKFKIPDGTFADREIDLAIPAPPEYPRIVGASMHVKANPHLLPFGSTEKRNITTSTLGTEWQYWSYRFQSRPKNPTLDLISQINEIYRSI